MFKSGEIPANMTVENFIGRLSDYLNVTEDVMRSHYSHYSAYEQMNQVQQFLMSNRQTELTEHIERVRAATIDSSQPSPLTSVALAPSRPIRETEEDEEWEEQQQEPVSKKLKTTANDATARIIEVVGKRINKRNKRVEWCVKYAGQQQNRWLPYSAVWTEWQLIQDYEIKQHLLQQHTK
ncbi:MAG: hypothetical protein H0U27_11815 [Nitrosopumilus sp.]|nr:hypothetical protein [Nitrosopumilus sp.]